MSTINTSTASTATAYSNQRKVDRCQNGVLWAIYGNANTNPSSFFYLYYSTDNGTTWNYSNPATFQNGNSYITNASFFIDVDDYAHLVYKHASDGYIYYLRGTPNAARTAWTWSAAFEIHNQAGYNGYGEMNMPDVVAHREGTGWKVHTVAGGSYGGGTPSTRDPHVSYMRLNVTSAGVVTIDNETGLYQIFDAGDILPSASLDFNHTGDGKTVAGGTPHLYVAWSAGATGAGLGIRFKKATYSAGTWAWGTEREIDSTIEYGAFGGEWGNCLYDGTRVIIGGIGSGYIFFLHERDAADTTTIIRRFTTGYQSDGQNMARYGAMSYDQSGNVYFIGKEGYCLYRKWNRGTSTLDSTVNGVIANGPSFEMSVKRGYSNQRIEFIYTDGTASPYSVNYGSIVLNVAPGTPTLTSPNGAETISGVSPVTWIAATDSDAGPSALTYEVSASSDNGATWTTLGTGGATATSCYANFSLVTPSATCLVRVRAFDGQDYGPYDQSNAVFTVVAPTPVLKVDVGSFTKRSGTVGTGNQDIVIPRDMTTAPAGTYAIMFWTAGSDQASNVWDAGIEACIGFTTGPGNSYAKAATSNDAVATADTSRRTAMKCITLVAADGTTTKAEADFVSFPDATHMRINWTTNVNDAVFNAIVTNYMIVSGLVAANIVKWLPNTAGDKSVAGVGFTPDLVINAGTTGNTVPLSTQYAFLGFGGMNKHGQQVANAISSQETVNPSNTNRWQQTDASQSLINEMASQLSELKFKSMDTDGFTVNCLSSPVSAYDVFSLCLKGVSSKIGAFTAPSAAGTQVIDTRQTFTPKGALFSSIGLVPTSAPASNAVWSLGATDMTNRRAVALTDVDAVSPTQVKSVQYNNAEIVSGTAGVTNDVGAVISTTDKQTTLNWITKDGVAREYLYLLIGDAGTDTFPAKVS